MTYILYFHVAEVLETEDKETNDEVEYEEDEVDELENENLGEDIDIDEALDMVSVYLMCLNLHLVPIIHAASGHPTKFQV